MALDPAEQGLVEALQRLREQTGWAVYQQARALGLPIETLRAVLYGKNRPGPKVLCRLLAYVDQTRMRLGPDIPPVLEALEARVLDAWQGYLPRLLDRFWNRIRWDFRTTEDLAEFLRVDAGEWIHFTRGENPSPTLLQAVNQAYSHEAERLTQQDADDAKACRETAKLARLLLRLFADRR